MNSKKRTGTNHAWSTNSLLSKVGDPPREADFVDARRGLHAFLSAPQLHQPIPQVRLDEAAVSHDALVRTVIIGQRGYNHPPR